MFSFLTGNFRLYAIIAAILAVVSAFWYVSGLRADLAESEANNQRLSAAVATQQQTIDQLQKDSKKIKESNDRLTATLRGQNQELDNLRKKLRGMNLGPSAVKDTSGTEKKINQISKNVERCLEIASGAALTESEKNAKNFNEINQECPGLANPNFKPSTN